MVADVNGWINPLNQIGDFVPVVTRSAYRRRGVNHAALLECLSRMQRRGVKQVCVSTTVTNTPAIRLYEGVGFRIVNWFLEYVRTTDNGGR